MKHIFDDIIEIKAKPLIEYRLETGEVQRVYVDGSEVSLYKDNLFQGRLSYERFWDNMQDMVERGEMTTEHLRLSQIILAAMTPPQRKHISPHKIIRSKHAALMETVKGLYTTMTVKQIAERVGRTPTTVYAMLRQMGLPTPRLAKSSLKTVRRITRSTFDNVFDWSLWRVHQLEKKEALDFDEIESGMRELGWDTSKWEVKERIHQRTPIVMQKAHSIKASI